jgi:hypothetical protein
MREKKASKSHEATKRQTPSARRAAPGGARRLALPPPARRSRPRDTGLPGGGQGRVDLTGTMPQDIRIDPDLTEDHPGYQESGDSEIIPTGLGGKRRSPKKKTP